MSEAAPNIPKQKKVKKSKKAKKQKEEKVETQVVPPEVVDAKAAKAAKKAKKAKKRKANANPPVAAVKKAKKAKTAPTSAPASTSVVEGKVSAAEAKAYREENTISVANWEEPPVLSFKAVNIADSLLSCVSTFERPSPIQAECWKPLLAGRDVIGIAQTGSGKTLGFGVPAIPILQSVKNTPGVFMLVIAPTRELAIQIDVVLKDAFAPIKTSCIYGGGEKKVQLAELRAGAKCVSATPGRLLGLVREGHLALNKVRYFVMDEADRMLDMGFEPAIREIAGFLGERPQTLLFSATWPVSIQKLASEFVNNPVHVTVGNVDQLTSNTSVTQIVEVIDDNSYKRQQRLLQLLQKYHSTRKNKILIFVLYKKEVPQVARILEQKGYGVAPISSDFKQNERMAALDNFRTGRKPLLIATDVAARGLDIDNVSHVINFSFPLTVEDYIHRIGRTGRGGATGLAHTFFTQQNKTLAGELVGVLEDAKAEVPEALRAFGCFTKVKEHSMYGAHFKASGSAKPMPSRKRVTF